jgi:acyl dehydratase
VTLPERTMDGIDLDRIRGFMEVMRDVNPVHDDPELVERLGLRGPVNQGPANLAYMLNMLIDWTGDVTAIERLDFRFLDVVTTGDVVTAGGEVVELDADGKAICDVWLDRADGTRAVTATARVRPPAAG